MVTRRKPINEDGVRARRLAALLFGVVAFSIPTLTQNFVVKNFRSAISVKISRAAPPLAAIEDEMIAPLIEAPAQPLEIRPGQIHLKAGRGIFRQGIVLGARSKILEASIRTYNSAGLTISRQDIAQPRMLAGMNIRRAEQTETDQATTQEASIKKARDNYFEQVPTVQDDQLFLAALPAHLRARAQKLDNLKDVLNSNWTQPTFEQQMATVQERVDQSLGNPAAANIPTQSNGKTNAILDSNNWVAAVPPAPQRPPPPRIPTEPIPDEPNKKTDKQTYQDPSDPKKPNDDDNNITASFNKRTLSGRFEMKDGLAYVGGSQQLNVVFKLAGETRRYGTVSVQNGTYKIEVEKSETEKDEEASIAGELRNADGSLVGYGEQKLAFNQPTAVNLLLSPIVKAVRGNVISAYDNGSKRLAISQAQVELRGLGYRAQTVARGLFVKEGLLPNSTFILEATKPQYWKSLAIASNESDVTLTMFPEKMMQGLASYLNEEKDFEDLGVIWGQVRFSGVAVEGASVQIDGSTAKGPIYFNSRYLPDVNRGLTSSNGLFAFVKVKPGVQVVRAIYRGVEMPVKIIPVDKRGVSKVEFSSTDKSSDKKIVETRVYDGLKREPIAASTKFTGTSKISWTDDGLLKLKYSQGQDPIFLEADAGPAYMQSRITASRTASTLDLPVLRYDWLKTMARDFEIAMDPRQSLVVGLMSGKSFRVVLDSRDANSKTQLVYFNAAGEPLLQAKEAPEGGGFVLFNVPPGFRTIMIEPKGSREILSKVVYADSNAASVITQKLN